MMSGHLSALNAGPTLSIDGFLKQRERVYGEERKRERERGGRRRGVEIEEERDREGRSGREREGGKGDGCK